MRLENTAVLNEYGTKRRAAGKIPCGLRGRGAFVLLLFLAALLLEVSVFQASFWSTFFTEGTDLTGQTEVVWRYVSVEDMEDAQAQDTGSVYVDDQGFSHVPDGAVLLRLKGLSRTVSRLHLALELPEGALVRATVFAQDEGNSYTYQLGDGRTLLQSVPLQEWMKLYPYGKVDNLYIRLETADLKGQAAAGAMGELVFKLEGVELDMRMPFAFHPVRLLLVFALLFLLYLLRGNGSFVRMPFAAKEEDLAGSRKRMAAVLAYTAMLLAVACFFVGINPDCKKNLAVHHAQYQELARALAAGEVSVGEADPMLAQVENPYDTIYLQAKQIPYQADYAYFEGRYYVYFGIVPELLLYLPFYLLTGRDLPNYAAVFLFFAGFIVASAGLVYELMKRFFSKAPFYLYGIGVFMLVGGYSYFYLLLRPDLYHVPIAASCMFTAAGLWFYLAGCRRKRREALLYALGSLCLALTAGCRPQFVLFAVLAVPLFWPKLRQKQLGAGALAALVLPYMAVAAGLMYYNAIRFGSPFDFGATYSLTSNDMTHRGFNLERIFYGMWYFLFQPARLEANFPYLRSAAVETDYLGRMMSESIFGGIFACSLLTWPLLCLGQLKKQLADRTLFWMAALSAVVSLLICAADATGAGILQRYSSDISFGIFLAAFPCVLALEAWAKEKRAEGAFLLWMKAALLLHLGFLFLILIQNDGSVNLLTGNPRLYYGIQAMLRF